MLGHTQTLVASLRASWTVLTVTASLGIVSAATSQAQMGIHPGPATTQDQQPVQGQVNSPSAQGTTPIPSAQHKPLFGGFFGHGRTNQAPVLGGKGHVHPSPQTPVSSQGHPGHLGHEQPVPSVGKGHVHPSPQTPVSSQGHPSHQGGQPRVSLPLPQAQQPAMAYVDRTESGAASHPAGLATVAPSHSMTTISGAPTPIGVVPAGYNQIDPATASRSPFAGNPSSFGHPNGMPMMNGQPGGVRQPVGPTILAGDGSSRPNFFATLFRIPSLKSFMARRRIERQQRDMAAYYSQFQAPAQVPANLLRR